MAGLNEVAQERCIEPLEEASLFGDGSALVVAAPLAPTGVPVRRHLLQVSAAESGNSENADNSQHDADPPVPHICRKHDHSVAV